jgi:hypothetical protein
MGVDVTRRFGTRSFRKNPGRVALSADEATVSGHVVLERVQGQGRSALHARQARGGLFSCAHGAFENPGAIALSADGITVNAFLSDWYSAKGAVRFEYATIKGDLRHAHCESMSVAFRLSELQAINGDESAT